MTVAIEAREVTEHLNLGDRERPPRRGDDVVALAGVDLQADRSARREDSRRVVEELPDEVESI